MESQSFDRSSKWLLEHHPRSLLFLAGLKAVASARALQAEVVQPRSLPDGLLEVTYHGEKKPSLVLVQVATYPEKRVVQQIHDDILLVYQSRRELPDAFVLVLREKGQYRVPRRLEQRSPRDTTELALGWEVVELWTQPAEDLLEGPEIGLIPWATLAAYDGSPEVLLKRCRDRIDREGGREYANLLAVTQVMARLRYNRPNWLDILGGKKAMIESPLLQEIMSETEQRTTAKDIVTVLRARFETPSEETQSALGLIHDLSRLDRLLQFAAVCLSLERFEERLREELPPPTAPSTRRKRSRKSAGES